MLDQAVDKPTIVNWALADLGQPANYSVDSETRLGGLVDRVWDRTVYHCFFLTDWNFCRQTSKLSRRDATPETGWRWGFDLPGDRLGDPLKVMRTIDRSRGDPLRAFDIEGDVLYADEPDVWARVKVWREPDTWDPGFLTCFTKALAGYLAVPVLQDEDLRDGYLRAAFGTPSEGGAGGMFGRLIAQHRATVPLGSPLLNSDPLTAARW